MRVLSRLGKEKKGLSDVVAYVLLIVIAVALSVLIYAWLKFFVEEGGFNIEDIERCSEDVGVIIKNQRCISETGDVDFNLTLKNQGLFNVSGFIVRVHNRSGAESGFYLLEVNNTLLAPGQEINVSYDLDDKGILGNVTLVEIQPFLKKGGEEISCASYITQEVSCSVGVVNSPHVDGFNIIATKIMCENEFDLPNWMESTNRPNITEDTALNFLSTHPNCHREPNWQFQWTPYLLVNPGNNLSEAPGWNTFGPTDSEGVAKVFINNSNGMPGRVAIREVFKEGYIPFTYNKSQNDNVSAELCCHMDVGHYDNNEYLDNPVIDNDYYCVAFNVPKGLCGNGVINTGEICDEGILLNGAYGNHCNKTCTGYTDYCGDGSINQTFETCDSSPRIINGVSYSCNNRCQLIIYNGFSIGQSFPQYRVSQSPRLINYIQPVGVWCDVASDCGLWKSGSGLNVSMPNIPIGGNYNLTYQIKIGSILQFYEDYEVYCGGAKVLDFNDNRTDNGPEHLDNHSVTCSFNSGKNNVVFLASLGSDGNSTHFNYFKVEGPLR